MELVKNLRFLSVISEHTHEDFSRVFPNDFNKIMYITLIRFYKNHFLKIRSVKIFSRENLPKPATKTGTKIFNFPSDIDRNLRERIFPIEKYLSQVE